METRSAWLSPLTRMSTPVLDALEANELRRRMPIECIPGHCDSRNQFTHLEACGRLLAGLAPWLELADVPAGEADLQTTFRQQARLAIKHGTDPEAPDFFNFAHGQQPIVDAAFLAHAILRAPEQLWATLDVETQANLVAAMQTVTRIAPGFSNWLLFGAMVEAFLEMATGEGDLMRVDYAIRQHEQWYKGHSFYGDGPMFHADYYNSFVIQPMLLDVLAAFPDESRWDPYREPVARRAAHHACIQEQLVAPDGSYPALGRSITYRCGAFQMLAQVALQSLLPESLKPAQARRALSLVIDRTLGADNTYDADGWLRIGLSGHQPALGETYISTGSLYLCSVAFLPLGLPANNPFWAADSAPLTWEGIWSGKEVTRPKADLAGDPKLL